MKPFVHHGEQYEFGERRLFCEPRYYTYAAIGIGVAGLALSAGEYAYSASNQPQSPNLSASSARMADVQASELPIMDLLQSAAETGGTALNPGYTSHGDAATVRGQLQQQLQQLQSQLAPTQTDRNGHPVSNPLAGLLNIGVNQKIQALQNQLNALPASGPVYYDSQGNIAPASKAVTNFAGYGTADVQRAIMEQEAQGRLDNARQFDPQFIAAAAKQEALSNPQGVQARADMYNEIQDQIKNPPTSPVAQILEGKMTGRANAGSGLTPEEQAMLDKDVNGMGSITGTSGAQPDLSSYLTTGEPGQQRAIENAMLPAGWLASGETPSDIQYRSEEQDLANLSKYISGQTPESEFSQLSGAATGPTPTYQSPALPAYNSGAAAQGASAAINQYGQQVDQNLNTPSPWAAGISGVLGVGNALLNFQPAT